MGQGRVDRSRKVVAASFHSRVDRAFCLAGPGDELMFLPGSFLHIPYRNVHGFPQLLLDFSRRLPQLLA